MLRVPREIKSFDGVGWGSKPQVKLAGGPTYHEIVLTTNLTAAQINRVSLELNGDPIIQLSGADMLMLEQYKKHWTEPGKFIIPIADITGKSFEGQGLSALATFPADNIILKVDVAEEPAAGSPAVQLRADAWVSAHRGVREAIPRISTITFNAGATGRNILDTLPNNGHLLRRMHMRGDIDALRIRRDKVVVYEQSAGSNAFMLKRRERAPQAGYHHFDPVQSGFVLVEMFNTLARESLEFEMEVNSAGHIAILLETLEPQQQAGA